MERDQLLEEAAANLDVYGELRGKRIRVVRAIAYEGEAAVVLRQLALSLPLGEHVKGVATVPGRCATPGLGQVTLTVAQGPVAIIE